jgi:phosphatidylserine decarboxylase precursor-related protein
MIIRRSKIAVEGLPYIGILGFLAWVTALFGFIVLSLVFGIAAAFVAYFFRDPERAIPEDPYAVVSPADGRVVEIQEIAEKDFLNRDMRRIAISLAITDCHINRFPVTGKVASAKYSIGKFHIANLPGKFYTERLRRASEENERLVTLIETEGGEQIVVAQVAGFVARRIVSYLEPGDLVEKGERFGMIKFGSRVDVYLPLWCEVSTTVGDKIKGGETIIGWLREKSQ